MKYYTELKLFVLLTYWIVMPAAWPSLAADEVDKMLNVEEVMQKAEARLTSPKSAEPSVASAAANTTDLPAKPQDAPAVEAEQPVVEIAKEEPAQPAVPLKNNKSLATPAPDIGAAASQDVAVLRTELIRREQELVLANQEIERLKDIVRRIQEASRREIIIFHYNKAAVYRASLMYKKAEEEYLAALTMDSNDAAVHYNLAILYDDNFKDKKKARIHYERFLELAPDDADAPKVREWLASIVM